MSLRNQWLSLDDRELAEQCELEFFKGTGNGGQKRNKTSSAVRVRHSPSGLAAEDCTERSQHLNRKRALYKLRMKIALGFREVPEKLIRQNVATEQPEYPLWCAILLDHLAVHDYTPSKAAENLGMSSSALLKLLHRDPVLWQEVNSHRQVPLRF